MGCELGNGQHGNSVGAGARAYKEGKAVAMIPFRMLLLCLCLIPRADAQEPGSTPGSDSSATSSSSDVSAKTAERKRRFEEMKKSLEEKNPEPAPAPASSTSATKARPQAPAYANEIPVSNLAVTMFVGETQRFGLYDNASHNLTAQAEWWVSDSLLVDLSINSGTPYLVGKKAGTVFVLAHTKLQTARVILRVLDRSEMKGDSVRWNQNAIAVHAPLYIVPAIPIFSAAH